MRRVLLAVIWLLALPGLALAKDDAPAFLLADTVRLEAENVIVAEGNVEALFDGQRLYARRVVYDRATNRLEIEGPVRLDDGSGMVLVADTASLDTGFRNGLLTGARMVLDQQMQIAALQLDRVDGRYSQLSRVTASSCQVCGTDREPLWQIRARRVIHDEEARQLYFDNAQFRVLGVPVFYLPRLRLPDPTVERARGFLVPRTRSTTQLGFGLKMPYFIPIGDHADLTLTPYVSPVTRTLEARYRQAFVNGDLTLNMALSKDTLIRDELRGYLFAEGRFDLRKGYTLRFDIETTTDDGYLAEYGYSGKDRLDSEIRVDRAKRDSWVEASLIHYESLRDGEDNATQPTIIGDARYERRLFPKALGGELRFALEAHSHYRYSDDDQVGRDVTRTLAEANWQKRWTLPAGLRAGVRTGLIVDTHWISQDSTAAQQVTDVMPQAVVDLRWPLRRREAGGAVQLFEPVVQVGWSDGRTRDIPNDESTRVEFDDGNFLGLSRFPAADRRERGLQAAVGLRWMRHDPAGWSASLTLGQVYRDEANDAFSRSSGLGGTQSDLLIAGGLEMQNGLEMTARALLGEDADVSKAEVRAQLALRKAVFNATYSWHPADLDEGRDAAIAEWTLGSAYDLGRHWSGTANLRYDLVSDSPARAAVGLRYQNECVDVSLSVARRYANSSNLEPSTDYGLTVALKGFSTGGSARTHRRSCGN